MNDNELAHYGVLGMRWGQRKSGSRASTGKTMSDEELTSKVSRMNLEKQYKQLSKETKPASKAEKTKKVVDASSSLVNEVKKINRESNQPKKEKMDLSKMTDQQLRERINRTNLEKQYNEMFAPPATVANGKRYASNILEVAGTTLAIGSSALGIALAIKELRG